MHLRSFLVYYFFDLLFIFFFFLQLLNNTILFDCYDYGWANFGTRIESGTHIQVKLLEVSCNISKTRASALSRVPNTEKQMKARGRRPSAFICFEVFGTRDKARSPSF